jgi:hypothetical protein
MQLSITLEIGDKKGVYLVVCDSKGVASEFMVPNYTLDFLFPVLTSAMQSGVAVQGQVPKLIPPCQR